MGWYYVDGATKKSLIAELTKGYDSTTDSGIRSTGCSLKHCYRGNAFSGVLWSVWEQCHFREGHAIHGPRRFIRCDIMHYRAGAWGYKPLEESSGLYHYSCPMGYLRMVPESEDGTRADWRADVASYHQRIAEKKALRREFYKPGITWQRMHDIVAELQELRGQSHGT